MIIKNKKRSFRSKNHLLVYLWYIYALFTAIFIISSILFYSFYALDLDISVSTLIEKSNYDKIGEATILQAI